MPWFMVFVGRKSRSESRSGHERPGVWIDDAGRQLRIILDHIVEGTLMFCLDDRMFDEYERVCRDPRLCLDVWHAWTIVLDGRGPVPWVMGSCGLGFPSRPTGVSRQEGHDAGLGWWLPRRMGSRK